MTFIFKSIEKVETDNTCCLPKFRVAIIGVPYNMSLIDGSVSGLNALYERLLKSRGFKVLLVNFKEITSQQTRIDRIKALEAKLKNLLSSDKT